MALKPGWDFGMARPGETEIGPRAGSGLQPFTRTVPRTTNVARTSSAGGGGGAVSGGMDPEALEAIRRAIAYYQPGGGFAKGTEAGLERGRVKAEASGMQHLVGAGLAGTTMAGTLGKKYQEEVAAPIRAGVEQTRAQAISGIEMTRAGMTQSAAETTAQRYFQTIQAMAEREEAMRRLQMQIGAQERASMFQMPTASPTYASPGGYARQFPSIYGESGSGPAAPQQPGDTADTPWPVMTSLEPPTGSVPYGRRIAPTIEEPSPRQPIRATDVLGQWGY